MRRCLLSGLLIGLVVALFPTTGCDARSSEPNEPQALQDVPGLDPRAIVVLGYLDRRQGGAVGARWPRVAFAIGDGTLLLTAAHCVDDLQDQYRQPVSPDIVVISPYYGDLFDFEIVAVDKKADVAILRAPWPAHPALTLASEEELAAARQILIASRPLVKEGPPYHLGRDLRGEQLPILKLDERRAEDALQLKGTLQVVKGWSGSPLLVPETGHVAGVLSKIAKRTVRRAFIFRSTRTDAMGCSVSSIHALLGEEGLASTARKRPSKLEVIPDAERAFALAMGFFEALFGDRLDESFRLARDLSALRPDSVQANLLLALSATSEAADPNTPEGELLDLAESSYKKALAIDPNHVHARAVYGNFLRRQGRTAEALAQSEAALAVDPNDRLALINRLALLSDREPHETEEMARRLIDTDPNDPHAWFYYSMALRSQGQAEEALTAAQEAVDLDPNGLFYGGLADALVKLDRFDEAEPHYLRMTERCGCQQCWYKYGEFLVGHCPDRLDAAERALLQAESMARSRRVSKANLDSLRIRFLKEKSPEQAETFVRDLLQSAPDNARHWWILADVLRTLGRHAEAAQAAREAVELRPDEMYRPRLANCLAKAGQLDAAQQTYDEMLERHPERPLYWYWYAEFLADYYPERIGEAGTALDQAQTATDTRWVIPADDLRTLRERIDARVVSGR